MYTAVDTCPDTNVPSQIEVHRITPLIKEFVRADNQRKNNEYKADITTG